jgi:hypothetical protein
VGKRPREKIRKNRDNMKAHGGSNLQIQEPLRHVDADGSVR